MCRPLRRVLRGALRPVQGHPGREPDGGHVRGTTGSPPRRPVQPPGHNPEEGAKPDPDIHQARFRGGFLLRHSSVRYVWADFLPLRVHPAALRAAAGGDPPGEAHAPDPGRSGG